MEQTHAEQKPKSSRAEITQSDGCGEDEANDQHTAQRVNQITNSARQRRSEQSHRRPRREHHPKLLRCQSALVHECRQKWRGDAEGRIHGDIEQNKSRQCLHREYLVMIVRCKYTCELTEELGTA